MNISNGTKGVLGVVGAVVAVAGFALVKRAQKGGNPNGLPDWMRNVVPDAFGRGLKSPRK